MAKKRRSRYDEGGEIDALTEEELRRRRAVEKAVKEAQEPKVSVTGGGSDRAMSALARLSVPVGEGRLGVGLGGVSAQTPSGRINRLTERELSGEMPFLGGTLAGTYAYDPVSKNKRGQVTYRRQFNEGGKVSASKRADGIAQRGKTRGKLV